MKRFFLPLFWIGLFFIAITSCDNKRIFDDYQKIPDMVWNKDSVFTFNFNVTSSMINHNLYLNVRNKINYSYSNLWLFVEVVEPNGKATKDTFEITLAEPSGKWLGEGFGGIKTSQVIFRRNVVFNETGKYEVKIQQGMRDENLEGISDIGFRLEKN